MTKGDLEICAKAMHDKSEQYRMEEFEEAFMVWEQLFDDDKSWWIELARACLEAAGLEVED